MCEVRLFHSDTVLCTLKARSAIPDLTYTLTRLFSRGCGLDVESLLHMTCSVQLIANGTCRHPAAVDSQPCVSDMIVDNFKLIVKAPLERPPEWRPAWQRTGGAGGCLFPGSSLGSTTCPSISMASR